MKVKQPRLNLSPWPLPPRAINRLQSSVACCSYSFLQGHTVLHFLLAFSLARDNYLKINQECVDSQGVKSGQGLLMAKVPGRWN